MVLCKRVCLIGLNSASVHLPYCPSGFQGNKLKSICPVFLENDINIFILLYSTEKARQQF